MAKILDVKVDELSFRQVMRKITDFLIGKRLHQIVTVNPEFIMAAQKDKEFKEILNSADLSVPDGFGLKFGAFFAGQKVGERITGVDLTWELAKLAAERGYKIFLLGAAHGIAGRAALRLQLVYPQLKIAGTYGGSPEDKQALEKIKEAKPDILLVAFGAPKQERFIYKLKSPELSSQFSFIKVAMGVGGTFDYISSEIKRAPKWMRNLGLEWLYRLIKQPERFNRIITAVIRFPLAVLEDRLK